MVQYNIYPKYQPSWRVARILASGSRSFHYIMSLSAYRKNGVHCVKRRREEVRAEFISPADTTRCVSAFG